MERDRREARVTAVQRASVEGVTRIHGSGCYPGVGCSARLLRGDHSVEAIRVFQEGKENRAFQAQSTVYANRGGKETACGL